MQCPSWSCSFHKSVTCSSFLPIPPKLSRFSNRLFTQYSSTTPMISVTAVRLRLSAISVLPRKART
ncbi:hypothetical protein 2209_scaffold64_00048 [Bacteriophage sp.]|nr:hypothetical protein 2209_scaffold64_00048 [Bacteriophage sp.]